jgi:hypothetical protein
MIRIGSLVKVSFPGYPNHGRIGLVTDSLEDNDGFNNFEVVFDDDRGWYTDLELEEV